MYLAVDPRNAHQTPSSVWVFLAHGLLGAKTAVFEGRKGIAVEPRFPHPCETFQWVTADFRQKNSSALLPSAAAAAERASVFLSFERRRIVHRASLLWLLIFRNKAPWGLSRANEFKSKWAWAQGVRSTGWARWPVGSCQLAANWADPRWTLVVRRKRLNRLVLLTRRF